MAEIIGMVSLKGGVGKTTVCAGVARGLASLGKKVCLIDCKPWGDLDLVLGCQDDALFCLSDLAPDCNPSKIFVQIDEIDFCAAPSEPCNLKAALDVIVSSGREYDYIILDDPDDVSVCDRAIIVTTRDCGSVRCAEIIGATCRSLGVRTGLVANMLPILEMQTTEASVMVDRTLSPLVGAIPFFIGYSPRQRREILSAVYKNIAARLDGEQISLFEGLKNKKKMQSFVI